MFRAADLDDRHGRALSRALGRLCRFAVAYPLTLVGAALLLLWLGVGLLNAAPASVAATSPASRSTDSSAFGGITLSAADKAGDKNAKKRVGGAASGIGDRNRSDQRTRPEPARRPAAEAARRPGTASARRPATRRNTTPRRSATPRSSAGCGWHAPLVVGATHCTSTTTDARGRTVSQQCIGPRATGCTVSTGARSGGTRVQSGCGPGRNHRRGGCSSSERTASSATRLGFTGTTGTTRSTASRGTTCRGMDCAASRRAAGRAGRTVATSVRCAGGPCTVRAGRSAELSCARNCQATARSTSRFGVPPRTTTANATCRGACTVRAHPRGVSCTKSRAGAGCSADTRVEGVLGTRAGTAKSVCRERDSGRCTARASVTASASCTSHGPQCRTRAVHHDDATRPELASDARCARHRAGRCSAASHLDGEPMAPASACRGTGGHSFCRTQAAGPAGNTTGACRQTEGTCRSTSVAAADMSSRCAGRGAVSTCETGAAAVRGVPTVGYCHGVGASSCVTGSSTGGGSDCSAGGRLVYCNAVSPNTPSTGTSCNGAGFHSCRTRGDARTRTTPALGTATCAAASATGSRRLARCGTSSTGASQLDVLPAPPARPVLTDSTPVPPGVAETLVPGYDASAGRPTAAQQRQARAELRRLQRTYQNATRQLTRLDLEGAALDAMARTLHKRGRVTASERSAIRRLDREFRRNVTTQQRRFADADGTLAQVARRAAPQPRGTSHESPDDEPHVSLRTVFADPWPPAPVVVGVAIDGLGNYRRATGTYQDAADRHRAKSVRLAARGKHLAAVRQLTLATRYQRMSDRLEEVTRRRSPLKHVPDALQRLLAAAPADGLPKSSAAMRTARRLATKVGWASVAGLAIDVGTAAENGKSVPRTAAKGGATVAASSTAGALTAAGLAATVPGPGWAVAGGIVVGTGVAWVMNESGAANWLGDKIGGLFD